MPKKLKETSEKIKDKLDYIGLDLENIPEFLKKPINLNFKASKTIDEKNYKIYKYIPINKIELLLTPTDRLSTTQEKYKESAPLIKYLNSDKEENIEQHTTFLNMLNTVSIEDIEYIDELQKKLAKGIPFGVKYYDNYIWQIYYSQYSDKYFMMVPTKETEYASFFYVLKKQIETSKKGTKDKIYVPVKYADYSEDFLSKSDIVEIENYIWLFTKNWASIYEVYDKNDKGSLEIVGEILIYEKIESNYKIKLTTKEEAMKFYKLIKALFILQTEIPHIYKFDVKITSKGNLTFYFNKKLITYDNLVEFVHKEYINIGKSLVKTEADSKKVELELEKAKQLSALKELEYIEKEKQIATYLQCKKTFFGKVKYFMKYKKANKKEKQPEKIKEKNEKIKVETFNETKDNYTIEDLVVISEKYNQRLTYNKNIKLDLKSINFKLKNIERKIKNATLYIEEIDKHKKNIFEFWKFATKDELPQLDEAEKGENERLHKLQKAFDYEQDIETLGEEADKKQRIIFSKKELDDLYITSTNILSDINKLKTNGKLDSNNNLELLKNEIIENKKLLKEENFDVFGSLIDDKTKIKSLKNKKHRENKKDKYKILNINKNTSLDEYIQELQKILKSIENSYNQTKALYNMSIYKSLKKDEKIQEHAFNLCNINPEEEINKCDEEEVHLCKMHISEEMPIVYFTNSIYFDNYNKTLPVGMDVSTEILVDLSKFDMELLQENEFRLIKYVDEKELIKTQSKVIKVHEYNLVCRGGKKK